MNLHRQRNNAPKALRLRRRTSESDLADLRSTIAAAHGGTEGRFAKRCELRAKGLLRTPFEQRGFALDLAIRKDNLEHHYSLRPSPRKLIQEGVLRLDVDDDEKIAVNVKKARQRPGHTRRDTPAVGELALGVDGASAVFGAKASARAKERLLELRSKVSWEDLKGVNKIDSGSN